jgi:hypothetical protein
MAFSPEYEAAMEIREAIREAANNLCGELEEQNLHLADSQRRRDLFAAHIAAGIAGAVVCKFDVEGITRPFWLPKVVYAAWTLADAMIQGDPRRQATEDDQPDNPDVEDLGR